MQRPFAVFDIDGTLVRWQMFHAIVHHLGKRGYINTEAHQKIRTARMQWKNRETSASFKAYEQVLVKEYLATLHKVDVAAYHGIVDEVFNEYKDQLFVYTRNLLAELKDKGYFLIAISGSHDEIISKLAKYHGFDVAVGAKLIVNNGAFSGELETPVHGKDLILKKLIKKHNLTGKNSYGIGDSDGDIPILTMVERPIAFNPSSELYAMATKQRWPIVVERKNVVYSLAPQHKTYLLEP